MGFIVTGSIETMNDKSYDSFYVRIEDFKVNKPTGKIWALHKMYTSKESAAKALPTYVEDYAEVDNAGFIVPVFTYNSVSYNWQGGKNYPLTEEEDVTVTTYSSSYHDESTDYIDFDDDGNEVIKTRTERTEKVTTGSAIVTKNKININLITGSVFEYAYFKVKEEYADVFGASNVNDLI